MMMKLICRPIAAAMMIACGCVLLGVCAAAAQQDDLLGPDRWPTTVEDTVRNILARLPAEDKQRLKTMRKEDLIQFHHGWGTGIRNYYGLRRGNTKLLASACGRPCHPDDASVIIIEAVWQELQR
jgi:uncharacterized protein DUF6794